LRDNTYVPEIQNIRLYFGKREISDEGYG